MLKTVKKMLDLFEKNKINYCHWKSNEHIIPALNGDTDLDILFDYSQRFELERIFSECGLKRFRATPLMQYNGIEDYIGFDKENAKIWHLHAHYKMTLGEKHLKSYTINTWNYLLLNNRIKNKNGIYTSSPEDELLLLLCRIALKLRLIDLPQRLDKNDKVEITWLLEQINNIVLIERAQLFTNEKIANVLVQMTSWNLTKKSQFMKLQKLLKKNLKIFTSYSRVGAFTSRIKRETFWFLGGIKRRIGLNNYVPNRRVSPAGGSVVALLGCDGAGKSTTIKYIKKEFNKKIDVVDIYFGSGDGSSSLFRKPMKKVAKKIGGHGIGNRIEEEYKQNHISLKGRCYSLAKIIWAISLAKEKKKKHKKMIKARNNGMLVLTDRYPQSSHPGCGDGPLLNKYIAGNGLLSAIAKWEKNIYNIFDKSIPDLTIILMVPTEVAITRKPDMTIEEIETKKKILKELNKSKNSKIINTDCEFLKSVGEVMEEIWKII